ncbi:hypothetical protein PoB_000713100 [Plakobranchus ocellatus]|uniref:Uncharacterized protein n=1 Tax=Plakobranchus ocellatus TaxID=259542 RepID=A0AAV3YBS1_9GAST|nr:hypothetical protein PoB_000713100 [Plakobranchus ocellatus]
MHITQSMWLLRRSNCQMPKTSVFSEPKSDAQCLSDMEKKNAMASKALYSFLSVMRPKDDNEEEEEKEEEVEEEEKDEEKVEEGEEMEDEEDDDDDDPTTM